MHPREMKPAIAVNCSSDGASSSTITGSVRLFDEPGTLDQAAQHAATFLKLHLNATRPQQAPAPGSKR